MAPRTVQDPVTGEPVRYLTRRQAGLPSPSRAPDGAMQREHAIAHHGVGSGNGATLREATAIWRGYHRYHTQDRGWLDIGYSAGASDAVDVGGAILEGRSWGKDGAHTQNGGNSLGYACCYIGDGRYQVGAGWWRALRAWQARGQALGAFTDSIELSGHQDWYPKKCPGDTIYQALHEQGSIEETDMPLSQEDIDRIAQQVWRYQLGPQGHEQPAGNRLFDADVQAQQAKAAAEDRREIGVIRRSLRKMAHAAGVPVEHTNDVPDKVEA